MPEPINAALIDARRSARALILNCKGNLVPCDEGGRAPRHRRHKAPAHAGGVVTRACPITRGVAGYGEVDVLLTGLTTIRKLILRCSMRYFRGLSLTRPPRGLPDPPPWPAVPLTTLEASGAEPMRKTLTLIAAAGLALS